MCHARVRDVSVSAWTLVRGQNEMLALIISTQTTVYLIQCESVLSAVFSIEGCRAQQWKGSTTDKV